MPSPRPGPPSRGGGFPGLGGFGGGGGFGGLARNGITLPPGIHPAQRPGSPKGVHIPGSFFRRRSRARHGRRRARVGGGFGRGARARWARRRRRGRLRGGGGGAAGGLLNGSTPSKQLTALLSADASRYTWVAATTGSNSASGYQLATGDPVMAIGGFNGTDPAPTLAQFEKYVSEGKIHYYIGGGGGFGGGLGSRRRPTPRRISPPGWSPTSRPRRWVASPSTT